MPVTRTVRHGAAAALLVGPCVLAFFTGGYFPVARTWAGALAWAIAAVALATAGRGLATRRGTAAWLAPAGLAGLTAWTAASITWAPVSATAYSSIQIDALYLGALVAAALLLGDARRRAWTDPVLALGIVVVTGYGLAGRLLPGLLHFSRSVSAQGRLEQPLTYWNAMGELAALGLVLCARLAADERRPRALRALAAAAAAPVGLALYVSFSRGALFAAAVGLLTLTVALPRRGQLWSALAAVAATVLASAAAAPLSGVTNLHGALRTREWQGALVLGVLVVIAVLAAVLQLRLSRSAGDLRPLRLPRHAAWLAVGVVCAGLAIAIAVGAKERSGVPISGGANRLVSLQSNRYAYWNVALKAFAHAPIVGVGAGGWSVWWLRDRPYPDGAQNAHSLELETLAEFGVIGIALLAAWLAGVGIAARAAHHLDPRVTAGPLAVFATWLAHTPLDWDWQMPAVTLVGMIAAGALVAAGGCRTAVGTPLESSRRPELQPI